MKSEAITAVLLLCALDLSVCVTIKFPSIHSQVSDCINLRCVRGIKACMDTHGKVLTRNLKGCVVQKCKGNTKICITELLEPIMPQLESLYPQSSLFVNQYADTFLTEMTDSFLHCWVETAQAKHLVCFGNRLLDVAQPLINAASKLLINHGGFNHCISATFSRKGEDYLTSFYYKILLFFLSAFVSCWLTQSLRGFVNCTDHLDDKYFKELKIIAEREMRQNTKRYVLCISKLYMNWNYCKEFVDTLLASSATRRLQYKDYMICSFHKVILATAKC
ncbi:uncharacterized protein LOC124480357 isoform X2 [Hypomesus transpacificus]|uniref:uncharacterized protein LOC124480357 isoform X2 n=1 Tax=Hypomesus transpacificus TaxID=137520 RepID=UPI001F080F8C|nr:uncharacterized protein LOC124480357 isoform X2 [Hypomesus transpacificus]XP_046895526.1 uncharacterized protein LOC124480357 isoform X2 [Hypomesus transpacificus]